MYSLVCPVMSEYSKLTNGNLPVRDTLVQLLALYPAEAQCTASQTDRQTDGQTDRRQDDANSRLYCLAVRSAINSACSDRNLILTANDTEVENKKAVL